MLPDQPTNLSRGRSGGLVFLSLEEFSTDYTKCYGEKEDIKQRQHEEAEDIKKRWQEYTEELYKKDLHDPDNHDGVITHLEPDTWNVKSSGP